jgi:hypothetical protein
MTPLTTYRKKLRANLGVGAATEHTPGRAGGAPKDDAADGAVACYPCEGSISSGNLKRLWLKESMSTEALHANLRKGKGIPLPANEVRSLRAEVDL